MSDDDDKKMFRKEALEKFSSNRRLEKLMIVVNPKGWVTLWFFLLAVLGIILWSFLGSIPMSTSGSGILINQEGNLIIESKEDCVVDTVLTKERDVVDYDQPILKMTSNEIALKLKDSETRLELLKKQFTTYMERHTIKAEAERKALKESILFKEKQILRTESELKTLYQDLNWKKELLQDGLVALGAISEVKEQINEKRKNIDDAKVAILTDLSSIQKLDDIVKIQEMKDEIQKAESQKNEAALSMNNLLIKSPTSGKILEVPVKQYENIKKGQIVTWMEKETDEIVNYYFYGYFSSNQSQMLLPGMIAEVKLRDVDPKLYGGMLMKVVYVWDYPTTEEEINKIIGNKLLVHYLTQREGSAPIQALLEPIRDESTPSGYKWTSKNGPPLPPETGAIGDVKVFVGKRKPIYYLLPLLREIKKTLLSESAD